MTLVEIIIAMAVFALLGVILLGIGQVVDSTTKASSRLNKKMTVQAPYAAAKNVSSQDTDSDGVIDSYYYTDESGNQIPVTPDNTNISIYFEDASKADGIAEVEVQKYEKDTNGEILRDAVTNEPIKAYKRDASGNIIKDASGNPITAPTVKEKAKADMNANKYSTKELVEDNSLIYDANSPNADLNFQFVEIQP